MFCPQCQDEFRPGFTRCARCNVDLVEDLSQASRPEEAPPAEADLPVRLVEYCGFVALDDARQARDELRAKRIDSEILIRARPDVGRNGPVEEEFWIRVDSSRLREATAILGAPPEVEDDDASESGSFACGECGATVAEDETFCAGCGARFE